MMTEVNQKLCLYYLAEILPSQPQQALEIVGEKSLVLMGPQGQEIPVVQALSQEGGMMQMLVVDSTV